MFRYFENLVDPFVAYHEVDAPPTRLWPFMLDYSRPFFRVFFWAALVSIIVAGVEIGLIYYMGRVVDLLGGTPAEVWQNHGTELLLMAAFVLLLDPQARNRQSHMQWRKMSIHFISQLFQIWIIRCR